ncbi:MAG: nicotinate (nicotinamide) nucleotide adenylyltransferase [Bdellovibrionaceae bacterium]|nr:nicotinate (nicotinamide) nucleotide adenylyltransferase [Pseudobdellovibrionaceae bacterium]
MKKQNIGIFGGAFNPPHEGHLQSLRCVAKATDLNKILVVPYYQSPQGKSLSNALPTDRLHMLSLLLSKEKSMKAEAFEIKQKSISYTYLTIEEFRKKNAEANLFLIMGVDSFETFSSWKNFEQILNHANVVVTTRAGVSFSDLKNYIPSEIKAYIMEDINFAPEQPAKKIKKVLLATGKHLYFLEVPSVFASSTDLRSFIFDKKTCPQHLSKDIFSYIEEHNLYLEKCRKVVDLKAFTVFCSQFLTQQGGVGTLAFNLPKENSLSDFSIISSADNNKKVNFLAETLIQGVLKNYGVKPQYVEGLAEGRWVILDYGFLVIHLFHEPMRGKYYMEELWKDCEEIK